MFRQHQYFAGSGKLDTDRSVFYLNDNTKSNAVRPILIRQIKLSFMSGIALFVMLTAMGVTAQTTVALRDVTFSVPREFKQVSRQNIPMKYDAFYENGKIFIDSTDIENPPLILYQYYENPDAGAEQSQAVLQNLNAIMSKDIASDTLIINAARDYSVARYQIAGKTLYEVKSLGERGWLNVQLMDKIENDQPNFQKMLFIAASIKHSGAYGRKYKEQVDYSVTASKWFIVVFGIYLLIYGLRKWHQKNNS